MKHHATPTTIAILLTGAILTGAVSAQNRGERRPPGIPLPRTRPPADQSPPPRGESSEGTEFPTEFRSINGLGNHLDEPELGNTGEPFLRLFENAYADGVGEPAGQDRPSARAISNAVVAQTEETPNERGATDYLWQWGQFLDHDIDETPTLDPAEAFDIEVPTGDPWFDPYGTGSITIAMNRSYYELIDGARQQVNEITAFIDASNVYGSEESRAYALRMLDGSGMLKTTDSVHGPLLPYNEGGFANAPTESADWFLAGDVRANEQAALTAMHTLFVREHNHWARSFREANPSASEDDIYEFARMIVGAEMQHITYREFLPILLGPEAIPPYRGYREEVDPSIANEFATAVYRFGHSLLPNTILRLDEHGDPAEEGNLELASAFFDPSLIEENGIDSLLRGLAAQPCQELDNQLVDGVRNFLFGPPGAGGFDLASLNIQRGRDHGLPSYNEVRRALGMRPARHFRDVHPDREIQDKLAEVYSDVDQIDLWVGGLCEPHVPGAMVGPVIHRIVVDQFVRLRDGDRFWYEHALAPEILELVEEQTLARIIRRNTGIGDEIQDHVFLVPGTPDRPDELRNRTPQRRPDDRRRR